MADKIYFAAASSLEIKNYIVLSNDNYNSLCKINAAFSARNFDNLGEIIVFNMSKEKADNKVKVAAIASIERLDNTIKINFKDIIERDIKNETVKNAVYKIKYNNGWGNINGLFTVPLTAAQFNEIIGYLPNEPKNVSVEPKTSGSDKTNITNVLILFAKHKSEFFAFNNYISQSEIDKFKQDYCEDYDSIKALLAENKISNIDLKAANELIEVYDNLTDLSKTHNAKFLNHNLEINKNYFDNILKSVDTNVMLDDEQRRAILADENYCLLIAGAGAGKTTTMAAKVKYLTEIKGVKPQDIVVISFTNKAIDELKERIQEKLGIPANIVTFHKFGYDILRSSNDDAPSIEYSAARYVFDCLEKQIFNNKPLLKKVMLFLGYYLNIPEEALQFENLNQYYQYKADTHFQTIKSNAGDYIKTVVDKRKEQNRTITGEYVRSNQEVQIANFLYLNGIEYEYEKPYPIKQFPKGKPYTPDFTITQNGKTYYLEHFGISENYLNNRFSSIELEKYKNAVLFKRKLHKNNNTALIETFSAYNDRRSIIEHLREKLNGYGIDIKPKSDEEVYKNLSIRQKTNMFTASAI